MTSPRGLAVSLIQQLFSTVGRGAGMGSMPWERAAGRSTRLLVCSRPKAGGWR